MDIIESIERYVAGTDLTPGTRTRLIRARDEIVRLRKALEQPAVDPCKDAEWDQAQIGDFHMSRFTAADWVELSALIEKAIKEVTK